MKGMLNNVWNSIILLVLTNLLVQPSPSLANLLCLFGHGVFQIFDHLQLSYFDSCLLSCPIQREGSWKCSFLSVAFLPESHSKFHLEYNLIPNFIWNEIPVCVRESPSLFSFKISFKKFTLLSYISSQCMCAFVVEIVIQVTTARFFLFFLVVVVVERCLAPFGYSYTE